MLYEVKIQTSKQLVVKTFLAENTSIARFMASQLEEGQRKRGNVVIRSTLKAVYKF